MLHRVNLLKNKINLYPDDLINEFSIQFKKNNQNDSN